MSELKKCPFCGGDPRFDKYDGYVAVVCGQCKATTGYVDGPDVVWNRRVESAPSGWVKCSERLPEDLLPENTDRRSIKVLAAIVGKNGHCVRSQTRYYYRDRWVWKYSAGEVTHWMALPEPPGRE